MTNRLPRQSPLWSAPPRGKCSQQDPCFDELLEAHRFQPFPLFMTIQRIATDTVINTAKSRKCSRFSPSIDGAYGQLAHESAQKDGLGLMADGSPAMSAQDRVSLDDQGG